MDQNDFNLDLKTPENEKKQNPPVRKALKKYFKEYCNSTSIHGFRYLGEDRSFFEKLWWVIFLTTSITCCILLINRTYLKWESAPVIVSFATTETPIYKIPFPAITICPDTKILTKSFNFTKVVHKFLDKVNLTMEEKESFGHFSLICEMYNNFWYSQSTNITTDNESAVFNETVGEEFFEFIEKRTPDFLNLSLFCAWMGDITSCSNFFTPIITDEGICYTFNMLDRDDFFTNSAKHFRNFHKVNKSMRNWDPTTFRFSDEEIETYPYRAFLSGANVAFSIVMITDKENVDYLCKDSLQGYRVLLHHPANIPRLSRRYFRVPLDQAVIGAVNPVMITTSNELKSYDPESRNCYFSHERKLKYYRVYTQDNCQMECQANFTRHLCNCTAFFMPRGNSSKICGPASLPCLEEFESLQMVGHLLKKFDLLDAKDFHKRLPRNAEYDCHCLPECSSIDYNVEISQSDWEWKKQFQAYRAEAILNGKMDKVHVSSLDLFIKKNQIMGLERHELYGPTDFIANFGGLLGLFTGFSIISFIEILYFASVRLLCNLRLYYVRKRNE